MAAIRVKGHYLEAQYRRLKPRRGHKRALGAVKHTMICAIWHMLSTGETYRDLGGDYFTNRDPERQTKRLVAQLERLGHHVTLRRGPRQPERTFPVRQHRQRRTIRSPPSPRTTKPGSPEGAQDPRFGLQGALARCRRRDSHPDRRIMIPPESAEPSGIWGRLDTPLDTTASWAHANPRVLVLGVA